MSLADLDILCLTNIIEYLGRCQAILCLDGLCKSTHGIVKDRDHITFIMKGGPYRAYDLACIYGMTDIVSSMYARYKYNHGIPAACAYGQLKVIQTLHKLQKIYSSDAYHYIITCCETDNVEILEWFYKQKYFNSPDRRKYFSVACRKGSEKILRYLMKVCPDYDVADIDTIIESIVENRWNIINIICNFNKLTDEHAKTMMRLAINHGRTARGVEILFSKIKNSAIIETFVDACKSNKLDIVELYYLRFSDALNPKSFISELLDKKYADLLRWLLSKFGHKINIIMLFERAISNDDVDLMKYIHQNFDIGIAANQKNYIYKAMCSRNLCAYQLLRDMGMTISVLDM